MQTTLMGLAIALIVALVTALVGPYLVNWNDYRNYFEAEASRIVGLDVRVAGDIDVRILPSPSVRLANIEIGPAGKAARLRAQSLGIEFGLGPLMRGELRAVELHLKAPQLSLGLNSLGQVDWPATTLAAETLSIDRLYVEDGRLILSDATSGARLAIEKLKFSGTVRSLIGPVRGDGTFVAAGATYAYRVAAGRSAGDGVKLKLAIEDSERPLNAELEGLLALEYNAPRFNGSLKLLRPAGVVTASGRVVAQEPWLFTSHVTATPQMALIEQIMFQYGPEERAASLTGSAEFKFGARPRLQGALSARQIDFDRLVATPAVPRQPPLSAIRHAAELFSATLEPAVATNVTISIDAVTLGGTSIQNLGADLRIEGNAWRLEKLEFRAPGFAQIKLSGRVDRSATGLGFAGALDVDVNDPRTLIGWLTGRSGVPPQVRPLRLRGEVALGADRIALEHLQASFDRSAIEGRLAYAWANAARPARLDAELTADEFDIDNVLQSGTAALAGMTLEWPREVALGLDIGRARIAGFEAKKIQARLKLDAKGIEIARLSVADFGNASIVASGQLATLSNPGGNITADVDARDLDGITALLERLAPALAGPLHRLAGKQNSAKLRLTLGLETIRTGNAIGRLEANGQIGAFRLAVKADATGRTTDFAITDLLALGSADTRIEGRLESDDGNALLALIGLDRLAKSAPLPGRLGITARRPFHGEWRIDAMLAAGPIDATGKGAFKSEDDKPITVAFDQVSGMIGGSPMRGNLVLKFAEAPELEGKIEVDTLDAPAALAIALGMPRRTAEQLAQWSSEPFVSSTSELIGHVQVKALRVTFSPTLAAKQLSGMLRFGPSQVVLDDISGELAGGRLDGRVALAVGRDGVTVQARAAVSRADAANLLAVSSRTPVTGKLSFQTEITGTGLSPAAFMGSIAGTGHITLEDAQLAGLNPRVFDAVIRAADLGIPTDVHRIRDFVASSLDTGHFPVKRADVTIAIKNGRARLADMTFASNGTELTLSAAIDLASAELDATMTLLGVASDSDTIRPTVLVTLKGPLHKPTRTVGADALASWLALRAVEQQSKRLNTIDRPVATTATPPDVTSALSTPAIVPPPEIDVGAIAPVEQVPPLPPAITVPRPPSSRPDTATVRPSHQPAARAIPRKPAAATPGPPLDLLGAQRQ